jgi:hypothetical protein
MIDGIPNRPLYFYQKDIIDGMVDEYLSVFKLLLASGLF